MLLQGRPKRMLLEGDILAAQSISKSEAEAAVKLGVSFMTYRKYAKMYGVYGRVSNKAGKGVDKSIKNEDSGKYPLQKVLEGAFPKYSTNRLKVRCIRAHKLVEECAKCGFKEKRISDESVPLLLNYIDANDHNKKLENLQLLCYNCFYLYVNNPFGCKKTFSIDGKKRKPGRPATVGVKENTSDLLSVSVPIVDPTKTESPALSDLPSEMPSIPDDITLTEEELRQLQTNLPTPQ